jgi:hypothetical protein
MIPLSFSKTISIFIVSWLTNIALIHVKRAVGELEVAASRAKARTRRGDERSELPGIKRSETRTGFRTRPRLWAFARPVIFRVNRHA